MGNMTIMTVKKSIFFIAVLMPCSSAILQSHTTVNQDLDLLPSGNLLSWKTKAMTESMNEEYIMQKKKKKERKKKKGLYTCMYVWKSYYRGTEDGSWPESETVEIKNTHVYFHCIAIYLYIWACDKRCSRLTRVCLYTPIYFRLTTVIQYALMSS